MKKLTSIFIVALFLFTTSCDKPLSPAGHDFQIERADVDFLAKGGEGVVDLISEKALTATCKQDWCKPTVTGNRINFTIAENTSVEGRNALLLISNGDKEVVLTITQLGSISFTNLQSKEFPLKGGEEVFKLETDLDLTFTFSSEDASAWLSYEYKKEEGTLTVTASALKGTESRSDTLFVMSSAGHKWKAAFSQIAPVTIEPAVTPIVGVYTLNYKTAAGADAEPIECIIKPTDVATIFELFPKTPTFSANPLPISAKFEDGLLSISGPQILFESPEQGTLALLLVDKNFGQPKEVQYIAKQEVIDGKTSFTFVDSRKDVDPAQAVVGLVYALFPAEGDGQLVEAIMHPRLVRNADE